MLRGRHRVVPSVKGEDLRPGLFRRPVRRIEKPVEGYRCRDVRTRAGHVERALPAEAIAGNHQLPVLDLGQAANLFDDSQQTAAQGDAVVAQPRHLPKHHIALGPTEFLPEYVRNESVVAELDQLLREPQLQVGHAHDGRDQHDRRTSLPVAPADHYAFKLFAFEFQPNRGLLAHAASNNRAACARASSVTAAPDNIRAISSRRSSLSRRRTVVLVPSAPCVFSMRKWWVARAATCGECVTTSTWDCFASRARRSPIA